jgi:hypothetical protein
VISESQNLTQTVVDGPVTARCFGDEWVAFVYILNCWRVHTRNRVDSGFGPLCQFADFDRPRPRYKMRAPVGAACLCSNADVSLLTGLFGALIRGGRGKSRSHHGGSLAGQVAFSSQADTTTNLQSEAG